MKYGKGRSTISIMEKRYGLFPCERVGKMETNMDNLRFAVDGVYLGRNSRNGIGKEHARVFVRRVIDGVTVDGLVPIIIFHTLQVGDRYRLDLTKANDPYYHLRTYIT
jgi:hypothetical protein